ncbi:hypothetical protein BH09DEP1_BH09DEP1_7980 [soil metagenome]
MFKRIFSTFFLTYSFLAPAMAVTEFNAGTVIDPINQVGQYTVSLPDIAGKTSGLQTVTDAGANLFSTKGIPVIISTVAGNTPWWALTTGTGYLLITQFDPSAAYASAITSGFGYAAGQEIGSKGFMSSTLGKAAQLALLATLIGSSYLSTNPLYSEAFMAAAQALGLQTVLALSAKTSSPAQEQKSCAQSSGIMNNIRVALNSGLADVLHVHAIAAMVNMLGACDSITLMRILLYEQAYRLAQSGSAVAKKLFAEPAQTETQKDKPQTRKKEHSIVTIM